MPEKKKVTEEKVGTGRLETKDVVRAEKHGYVYVEKSVTKNMGDYNSIKVTVGTSLPVNPTDQEILDAKNTAKRVVEVVDRVLVKEVDAVFAEMEEWETKSKKFRTE